MADRQALLNAIINNPEDDTPRLVFADFLDEQDNQHDAKWAELIRLGCKKDMEPGTPESKRLTKLRQSFKSKIEKSVKSISDIGHQSSLAKANDEQERGFFHYRVELRSSYTNPPSKLIEKLEQVAKSLPEECPFIHLGFEVNPGNRGAVIETFRLLQQSPIRNRISRISLSKDGVGGKIFQAIADADLKNLTELSVMVGESGLPNPDIRSLCTLLRTGSLRTSNVSIYNLNTFDLHSVLISEAIAERNAREQAERKRLAEEERGKSEQSGALGGDEQYEPHGERHWGREFHPVNRKSSPPGMMDRL